MRYFSGYPETVEVSADGMCIYDVEHLIVQLAGENNIHPVEKIGMMQDYRHARADYWNARYELTEEKVKLLNEVGQKLVDHINAMYALCDRLCSRELEKKENGKRAARIVELQTTIRQQYLSDSLDEETELYDSLFDYRERSPMCNLLLKCSRWIENMTDDRKLEKVDEKYTQTNEDGLMRIVHELQSDYTLAWKDLECIQDFGMKVKYSYQSI